MAMLNNQMVHPLSQIFKWTPDLLNHGFWCWIWMEEGMVVVFCGRWQTFFSISMDWLQTWDQKPKISNIALSCRLSFDAISTYILAYSLQRMYHGWAQVRQKNCSSWSDEHISLSLVIHLSSCFFSVYIYIHNYRYSYSFICFCGCVHIQLYIYYCYCYLLLFTHIRIMVILRSIYTCAC